MKTLIISLFVFLSFASLARAENFDSYFRNQLDNFDAELCKDNGGQLGDPKLSHIFLTIRANIGVGLSDVANVTISPELMLIWGRPGED